MPERLRILYHVNRPTFPVNGGDTARVVGFLKYFRSRRDRVALDVVSSLPINDRPRPADLSTDNLLWHAAQRQAMREWVDDLYVNEGRPTLLDKLTLKPVWTYHRTLRREELPVGNRLLTPPSYVRFVRRVVASKPYDVIWLNFVRYARLATRVHRPGMRKVMDVHDVYSCSRRSLKPQEREGTNVGLRFDFDASLRREVRLLDRFDHVILNSLAEQRVLLDAGLPPDKLVWMPHLSPNATAGAGAVPPYARRAFAHDLLYVGSSYKPNAEGLAFFFAECFPRVLARFPDVTLSVAGSVCDGLNVPANVARNVKLLGFVDDLAEAYGRARVFICPLLSGAGTKVKLGEAMSYALPIVTTGVGASGMMLTDGENAVIADGAEAFAAGVERALGDAPFAERIAAAVGATYHQHYSEQSIYAKIDRMLGI
jgi:glycosyltransferase involved in cell wall biosynthesis